MLTGIGNPRVMIVARVAIVLCHLMPEEVAGASRSGIIVLYFTKVKVRSRDQCGLWY